MPVFHYDQTEGEEIKPLVFRKLIYLNNLMVTILDFNNGLLEQPDPPHHHPHEQITYVAEGELYLYLDGQQHKLRKGDTFAVPANMPHCTQPLSAHVRLMILLHLYGKIFCID